MVVSEIRKIDDSYCLSAFLENTGCWDTYIFDTYDEALVFYNHLLDLDILEEIKQAGVE